MRRTTVCATMTVVCAGLVVVAGVGCSVVPSGDELATVTEDIQRSEPAGERAVIELPVRSEDLVDMIAMEATLNAACPAPTTCTGFGACTLWSATTSCGTPVCGGGCSNSKIEEALFRLFTFTTRFRVCFNALGQQCTEFQVITASACVIDC